MALTTLLEYKTAVTAAGYDSVTSAPAILDAVNEARQAVVEERRWSWREVTGNTDLVLAYDTPSESLASLPDLAYVDAVRIEFGTEYYDLQYLQPQELRRREHIDRTPTVPRYWTEAGGQLRVYPSPDKAYTVTVDYIRTIATLAADTDNDNDIPPAFKACVKWKAVAALAYRTRDYQGAALAEQNYSNELRRKIVGEAIKQRQTSHQVLQNPSRFD